MNFKPPASRQAAPSVFGAAQPFSNAPPPAAGVSFFAPPSAPAEPAGTVRGAEQFLAPQTAVTEPMRVTLAPEPAELPSPPRPATPPLPAASVPASPVAQEDAEESLGLPSLLIDPSRDPVEQLEAVAEATHRSLLAGLRAAYERAHSEAEELRMQQAAQIEQLRALRKRGAEISEGNAAAAKVLRLVGQQQH